MIMVSKDRIRKVEVAGLAGFLSAAKLLPTSPARCVRPGDRHRPHPQITQAQQNVSPQAHTDIPSSHSLTPTDGQRCAPQAHPSPPIPTIWIPIRPPRPPIPVEVRTHGGAHESLHLQAEPGLLALQGPARPLTRPHYEDGLNLLPDEPKRA